MRRRLLALGLLTLSAACGGLLVNKGNAYPCDFDQAEGLRDLACPPAWVCSVSNQCQKYQDEGPQFDGPPPLPTFDGGLIFPAQLRGRVKAILPDVGGPRRVVLLLEQNGGELWQLLEGGATLKLVPSAVDFAGGYAYQDRLYAYSSEGKATVMSGAGSIEIPLAGRPPIAGLRPSWNGNLVVLHRGAGASEVVFGQILPSLRALTLPGASADATEVREARWLPRRLFDPKMPPLLDPVLVGASAQGLYWREVALDGGDDWRPLTNLGLSGQLLFRHDRFGAVWAVAGGPPGAGPRIGEQQVLATFELRSATATAAATLERPWEDCLPCAAGRIVTFAPGARGGTHVEVLCESALGRGRSLVKVTGAQGTVVSPGACETEPMDSPIALANLAFQADPSALHGRRYAVDHTVGGAHLWGGTGGELWTGDRPSELSPAFLDRVPRALGLVDLPDGGKRAPVIVTDRYLAAPLAENGFVAFRLDSISDSAQGSGAVPRVAVGEASGWEILSSADIARVRPRTDGGYRPMEIAYGGRLVNGRGEAAREPYFAEALLSSDGGIASVVLTADDSVYFYDNTLPLEDSPNLLPPITPQLTPEPNFPIRSMTFDRSPGDGSTVRGYLVTSRSLYEYTRAGQPARWSARPLILSSREPVAVWMDHPLSPRGRVGYRDGTVFTLPGGFPLVGSLPAARVDGGTDRVLAYDNLGGWPVALAESGLYLAGWQTSPTGALVRTLPDGGPGKEMSWSRLALPDGRQPWVGGAAALKVFRKPGAVQDGFQESTYQLWVFAEQGRGYFLGSLVRRDKLP